MTNDESNSKAQRENDQNGRMTRGFGYLRIGPWSLIRHSSFVIRHFLLLLGVVLLAACGRGGEQASAGLQLQVISPHGSDIRREFGEAFSKWHEAHFGVPVEVQWPDIGGGGTENVVKYLSAAYKNNETSGLDVVFGGGSDTFDRYTGHGFLAKLPELEGGEGVKAGWAVDPLKKVPEEPFGSPLHGKGDVWVAATMASFGMEINKDRIAELGLMTPTGWGDIAGPEWMGRLSLADPSKSGSVKASYEMILQDYGWEKGWPVLVRLFENAALVRDSGSAPADDVGNAEAVAGIVIDFYGRLQALRAGEKVVAYVLPEGGTSLDPDPIGMLKGAPHVELAARFVRFVVSPEGQRLWVLKAGAPGGPRKTALGRMTVLREIYEQEGANLFDATNPFSGKPVLRYDKAKAASRGSFIGDLIKAALIDNHEGLVRARRAVKEAGDRPELLAKLEALPTWRAGKVVVGALEYGEPKLLREGDLGLVAKEYGPAKDDPKGAYGERLQNGLRDFWRETFRGRFAEVNNAGKREMMKVKPKQQIF